MATQREEDGIPFSIAHDFQQFRLLELPPEIVELLDAPTPPRLSIKSQAPSSSDAPSASNTKPPYAVFCTPNKTFQIRQVGTSNSLFVTQQTAEAHGNDALFPTTRAIASCTTTLELHATEGSPTDYLDVLPVYDLVDGELEARPNEKTKEDIFAHIPFSDGQCEKAWLDMVAFEYSGSSYRPSAKILAQVWTSINSAALAEGVKLDQQFITEDLARAVAEEGHPVDLSAAICKQLSNDDQDKKGQWSCLDRARTVRFVGKNILQAKQATTSYTTTDFLDAWKDSLPEIWRAEAQLGAIEGLYHHPTPTTIIAKGSSPTTTDTPKLTAKAASARKWHEKFGKTRKK
ncbi:sister chromatid cohesion protein-like protein Dcc1 [Dendryphion nanum]|uniref:Sister chromatid cohesion protein-like protein Dcc1 n=1 Tax=Dendryphion nanum TaxID=256645 RepID=A0A9P9ITL4_9PLEO|nr:sister chromatid cohesion protein-like protein Dcc1 [Dendryphion nanum]